MDIAKKYYVKKSDCVTREIAGETIIVPVSSNVADVDSIYTLNEVGALVWQLMDGRTSVGQFVGTVCDEYDVVQEEAEKDVIELIDSLEAAGLIRQSDQDGC